MLLFEDDWGGEVEGGEREEKASDSEGRVWEEEERSSEDEGWSSVEEEEEGNEDGGLEDIFLVESRGIAVVLRIEDVRFWAAMGRAPVCAGLSSVGICW